MGNIFLKYIFWPYQCLYSLLSFYSAQKQYLKKNKAQSARLDRPAIQQLFHIFERDI